MGSGILPGPASRVLVFETRGGGAEDQSLPYIQCSGVWGLKFSKMGKNVTIYFDRSVARNVLKHSTASEEK